MLREKPAMKQTEYEVVLLDELVPQDHLLRKIDHAMDFSFIHDLCKDLYGPDNDRPAIEPELLFRILFIWICVWDQVGNETGSGGQCEYCVQMVSGIEADRERPGSFDDQYKPGTSVQGQPYRREIFQ